MQTWHISNNADHTHIWLWACASYVHVAGHAWKLTYHEEERGTRSHSKRKCFTILRAEKYTKNVSVGRMSRAQHMTVVRSLSRERECYHSMLKFRVHAEETHAWHRHTHLFPVRFKDSSVPLSFLLLLTGFQGRLPSLSLSVLPLSPSSDALLSSRDLSVSLWSASCVFKSCTWTVSMHSHSILPGTYMQVQSHIVQLNMTI